MRYAHQYICPPPSLRSGSGDLEGGKARSQSNIRIPMKSLDTAATTIFLLTLITTGYIISLALIHILASVINC